MQHRITFARRRVVFLGALVFAACQSPELIAPSGSTSAPPLAPSGPSHNTTTSGSTSGSAGTRLVGIAFQPLPGTTSYDYELRFNLVGYGDVHMEPRWGSSGLPTPGESFMPGRIRTGSGDYIHVEVCARVYHAGIYDGCYGSGSANFSASDNGVGVAVPFSDDWHAPNSGGMFTLTLQWTQVNVQPATVTMDPVMPVNLVVSGTGAQMTAEAFDASGEQIPALPISWSSSNPSAFGVTTDGRVYPLAVGSGNVVATISGVSASTVVNVRDNLQVEIFGSDRSKPFESCTFMAIVNSTDYVEPLSYSWAGPGGSTGSNEQYVAPGTGSAYNLTLTVTDATGRSGTAIMTVRASSSYPSCHGFF
jgi:hypothetical protein